MRAVAGLGGRDAPTVLIDATPGAPSCEGAPRARAGSAPAAAEHVRQPVGVRLVNAVRIDAPRLACVVGLRRVDTRESLGNEPAANALRGHVPFASSRRKPSRTQFRLTPVRSLTGASAGLVRAGARTNATSSWTNRRTCSGNDRPRWARVIRAARISPVANGAVLLPECVVQRIQAYLVASRMSRAGSPGRASKIRP